MCKPAHHELSSACVLVYSAVAYPEAEKLSALVSSIAIVETKDTLLKSVAIESPMLCLFWFFRRKKKPIFLIDFFSLTFRRCHKDDGAIGQGYPAEQVIDKDGAEGFILQRQVLGNKQAHGFSLLIANRILVPGPERQKFGMQSRDMFHASITNEKHVQVGLLES